MKEIKEKPVTSFKIPWLHMISPSDDYAFSVRNSVNITVGEKEERMMMTGLHTVVDIFCVGCGSIVGWKYVRSGS